VVVEFTVVSGKETDSGVCFLNSMKDFHDPKCFTAFITSKGLKKFKEDPKVEKPADYYMKKKVRVSGSIKTRNDQYQIEVNSPDQIKVVEDEPKAP
jgi:hypothetical protein